MSDRSAAFATIANGFDAHSEHVTAIVFDDNAETITVTTNILGSTEWLCEIGSDDDRYVFVTTNADFPVLTIEFDA